jgi:hypothetical protein
MVKKKTAVYIPSHWFFFFGRSSFFGGWYFRAGELNSGPFTYEAGAVPPQSSCLYHVYLHKPNMRVKVHKCNQV